MSLNLQCDCFTWATDDLARLMTGNGHNPSCPHYRMSVWWVFTVGDSYWYLARTADEAVKAAQKDVEVWEIDPESIVEATAVSLEELCDLTFYREDGSSCSFLEEFVRRIREPVVVASLFAAADY